MEDRWKRTSAHRREDEGEEGYLQVRARLQVFLRCEEEGMLNLSCSPSVGLADETGLEASARKSPEAVRKATGKRRKSNGNIPDRGDAFHEPTHLHCLRC